MRTAVAALIAIATVASSGLANAQSSYLWEELGSGDGITASYNPLSVRHSEGVVTFLEKISYASPSTLSNGKSMGYYTVEMTIACAADTFEHANYPAYTPAGEVIPGVEDPTPSGMNPISPDGVPAAFKTKFCK
jgi:hypothetical protein